MLKYLLFISCAKLTAQLPNSQLGAFNSIGNAVEDNIISIEYSIGEPITTTMLSINTLQSIVSGTIQPQITIPLQIHQEIEIARHYSFYPNPTSGNITIEVGLEINAITITILDIVGHEIHLPLQNNTLDLSSLKNGIYTLKVYNKNSNLFDILRVVKN